MSDRVVALRDAPPGRAFDAWRIPVLERSAFGALDPREQLEYLASLALLAPTTHNTVPQRMRIDAERSALHVALDRRAILPESDANGRQATVSLGAVIANACIAAEAYGRHMTLSIQEDAETALRPLAGADETIVPVATLVLEPTARIDAGTRRRMGGRYGRAEDGACRVR